MYMIMNDFLYFCFVDNLYLESAQIPKLDINLPTVNKVIHKNTKPLEIKTLQVLSRIKISVFI
jgi:hypothetical protein